MATTSAICAPAVIAPTASRASISPRASSAVQLRATGSALLRGSTPRLSAFGSRTASKQGRRAAQMSTVKALSKASPSDHKALVDSVDCFIFDCDGVIWKGDKLIDGVPETLDMLREMGKKMIFVTNNSTKSRAGYLNKFTSLGLNIDSEEIYSSSYAAAAYLESISFEKKVYVIGEVGICEELDNVNIKWTGGPEDKGKEIELKSGFFLEHDKDVGAVIVGFDRHVNYHKIQMATLCIRENPGCLFIATNLDAVTHLTDAQEWAGNGSMVGAIKGSTKQEPIVVGKPAEFMLANIADKFNLKRSQICMVGDRLDTDILFGKDGGLTTSLVLSGVTDEETLLSDENKIRPDYYMDKLPDLLSMKKDTVPAQ